VFVASTAGASLSVTHLDRHFGPDREVDTLADEFDPGVAPCESLRDPPDWVAVRQHGHPVPVIGRSGGAAAVRLPGDVPAVTPAGGVAPLRPPEEATAVVVGRSTSNVSDPAAR